MNQWEVWFNYFQATKSDIKNGDNDDEASKNGDNTEETGDADEDEADVVIESEEQVN